MRLRTRSVPTGLAAPALAAAALLIACGGEPASEPTPAQTPSAAPASPPASPPAASPGALRAEAEQIFATRCQTCHGPAGAGDGPGSAALTPKPRNFQDAEWQASVDDAHIANIIQYGGAAVGRSPAMPGNPDLTSQPQLVEALVQVIRDLGKG